MLLRENKEVRVDNQHKRHGDREKKTLGGEGKR